MLPLPLLKSICRQLSSHHLSRLQSKLRPPRSGVPVRLYPPVGQVLPQIVGEHRLDERMDEKDEGGDEERREVADGHPGLVRAGQEVECVHQRQRLGRAEEPRDGISRGTDLELRKKHSVIVWWGGGGLNVFLCSLPETAVALLRK